MWQQIYEDNKDNNFVLIAVGQDTLGAAGCAPFIANANPTHPSLIDEHHLLANLLGIVNIPQAVWINEDFKIVRPAEGAPPPPADAAPAPPPELNQAPQRMLDIMAEAAQIQADPATYHNALADWIQLGDKSRYALSPDEVIARSTPRDADKALGHAHFELASELEKRDRHDLAINHFREAHRLVPDSWTFRRQAWSLETVGDGPFARFWQGPSDDAPEDWPYAGDWLTDIRQEGPANYYAPFKE